MARLNPMTMLVYLFASPLRNLSAGMVTARTPNSYWLWATQVCLDPIRLRSHVGLADLTLLWIACFLTALQVSAGKMGKSDQAKSATVHANVHIGDAKEVDGYGLSVDLKIEGVQDQDLIDAAHQVSSGHSSSNCASLIRSCWVCHFSCARTVARSRTVPWSMSPNEVFKLLEASIVNLNVAPICSFSV